jgi:hypothetical protein
MRAETSPVNRLPTEARQVVHKARPALEKLARAGHIAKGVLYVTVGVLAVRAAMGVGGDTTDNRGALREIIQLPFGQVLLVAVAVALFGYALWRVLEGVLDPRHEGTDWKAVIKRIGYVISGLVHAGLGVSAVQLANGTPSASSEQTSKHWTAKLLAASYGPWLVGAVGAIVVGVGLYQLWRAYNGSFKRDLKLGEMSPAERSWTNVAGRFGLAAHGLVFDVMGIFLILAALEHNPNRAHGLGGALAELSTSPLGPWLLATVALGLMAYGIYMFVEARYRRIPT